MDETQSETWSVTLPSSRRTSSTTTRTHSHQDRFLDMVKGSGLKKSGLKGGRVTGRKLTGLKKKGNKKEDVFWVSRLYTGDSPHFFFSRPLWV